MPKIDDDTADALVALAKLQGKSPKEFISDLGSAMLRGEPVGKLAKSARRADDEEETAEEAKERWMREETMDPDGMLSPGGMTGGGIFGDGPVAYESFDPGARSRGEARLGNAEQRQLLRAIGQLVEKADQIIEGRALPDSPKRALPGRRR